MWCLPFSTKITLNHFIVHFFFLASHYHGSVEPIYKNNKQSFKAWPNGVASRPKFSFCVYLRLRLARACVHLRWLARACAHFGRDQICTQVDASFSPFGHPTQVNASWVTSIKPWPNGVASRPKFSTCVCLRLRLARACVYLRWLAMTCAHFGRDQICTQVDASFSPFGHPTQVNASWVTSISLLLANEIEDSLP